MRAVFAGEDGRISLRDVPPPVPRDGELLVRAACSLISPGTELHYAGLAASTGVAVQLGYCTSGHVLEVGEGSRGFARGDRVIAMGWGYATHAEQVRVPYRLCVKIPDDLPFESAVFANLAATSLHAVHRASLREGERVLVVGAGLVGQLVGQIAAAKSAAVYVADRLAGRLDIALRCGARAVFDTSAGGFAGPLMEETSGRGVKTVFLCIQGAATSVFADSVGVLGAGLDGQKRGVIVCVGRFDAAVNFSVEMGNTDIRFAARCGFGYRDDEYAHGRRDYEPPAGEATVDANLRECVELIRAGSIRPDFVHTDRVPFGEAPAAYELFRHPERVVGVTLHHEL